MKLLGDRARPDRDGHAVPEARWVPMPTSTSFPSGHSASARRSRWRSVTSCPPCGCRCGLAAATVAFSRVYTGVHYPGDVLVGAATGAVLGRLVGRAAAPGREPLTGCATMEPMTAPTLVGPRVTLRAYRDDDRVARQRHGWHREIERGYGSDESPTRAMTDDEARRWLDHLAAREAAGARCWAVESDGELAGAAFLSTSARADARPAWRSACTRRSSLGRGLGTEAIRLVLRHAFGTLGMHRVDLKVLDFNDRAIAAYRACGFVEEGRERESCWVDGRWHDDVVMGVLDREFAAVDTLRG